MSKHTSKREMHILVKTVWATEEALAIRGPQVEIGTWERMVTDWHRRQNQTASHILTCTLNSSINV